MNMEEERAARVEAERKRLLQAARARQIAAVEKWLRRSTKALMKSRREIHRSRALTAGLPTSPGSP